MPGAWQHHRMTSSRPGSWRTLLRAAVAVLAAVLAVVLPSAAGASAAQTRVGASRPVTILTVGAPDQVSAVQGRREPGPRPWFVSGACVAAEDAAEDAGANAADGDPDVDPGCDDSFTAGTKVLLASGAAVPISHPRARIKVGQQWTEAISGCCEGLSYFQAGGTCEGEKTGLLT
jgi:hypothetical protein